MTDYASARPKDVRALIRAGQITAPTTGMCDGYAQGNLVVLPKELAWDFLLFCQRNPKSVLVDRLLETSRTFPDFGEGSDIARDIPKYRVYEDGVMTGEYTDVSRFFDDPSRQLVSFLIGCSFSFESALLEAGIPVRQIEEGVNVPMYNTNIPCAPAGAFSGNGVRADMHACLTAARDGLRHHERIARGRCRASTACRFKSVFRRPSVFAISHTRITATR